MSTLLDRRRSARGSDGRARHDMRSYQRFRAPFTAAVPRRAGAQVYDATAAFGSYFYKALVLDCDGTLWGGILGEDLADGHQARSAQLPGQHVLDVQHEFLALQTPRRPALPVSQERPGGCRRGSGEPSRRWSCATSTSPPNGSTGTTRSTNLAGLAADLNIGLDSMIFLDDSTFECEAVRSQLPMVSTLQVPAQPVRVPRPDRCR